MGSWHGYEEPKSCNRGGPAVSASPVRPYRNPFDMTATNGQQAASPNGAGRHDPDKVRVAMSGVGNCASSFVQGVQHYRDADPDEQVPGLMHVALGGYQIGDIEFS